MTEADSNSKPLTALVKPGADIYSKFVVRGRWLDPEREVYIAWDYNIHSDVPVTTFKSPGSTDEPPKYALNGTWQDKQQFRGFSYFKGSIGNGRIYIKTTTGVVIKGPIEGGPDEEQIFVGSGKFSGIFEWM